MQGVNLTCDLGPISYSLIRTGYHFSIVSVIFGNNFINTRILTNISLKVFLFSFVEMIIYFSNSLVNVALSGSIGRHSLFNPLHSRVQLSYKVMFIAVWSLHPTTLVQTLKVIGS